MPDMPPLAELLQPLRPGRLTVEPLAATTLAEVLASGCLAQGTWHGIALTTAGPRAVTPDPATRSGLRASDQAPVPAEELFELRLWQLHPTSGVGHEVRWVAGHPTAVRLDLRPAGDPPTTAGEPVLWRVTHYLQRAEPGSGPDVLAGVEIFMVEPTHGNTEYIDEIATSALGGL